MAWHLPVSQVGYEFMVHLHMPVSQASPADTGLAAPTVWPALWAFLNPGLPRHQPAQSVQTGAESGLCPDPPVASSGLGTEQMLVNECLAE